MANLTVTNIDLSTVILKDADFANAIVAFPGADSYAEGTIMARKQVSDIVNVTADAGNTGDGTVTAVAPVAGDTVPLVGDYNLEVTAAATNGGTLKLEDPNGNIVETQLVMIAGAGAATTFVAGGLTFTVTDGATDFIVGDKFALTVAADGDFVIYDPAGVGGAQLPAAVLTYDLESTGAADLAARLMVSGDVRREKLVIDDGTTVSDYVVDQLRDMGITALSVNELNIQDNQ